MTTDVQITKTGETENHGEKRFWATARVLNEGRYGSVTATFWGADSAEEAEAGALKRLESERAREAKYAEKQRVERELTAPHRSAAMRLALDKSQPRSLARPENVLVGDVVAVWGHGSWRHGIAVWLSPTGKVAKVLYFTPSGMVEHLTKTNEFYR